VNSLCVRNFQIGTDSLQDVRVTAATIVETGSVYKIYNPTVNGGLDFLNILRACFELVSKGFWLNALYCVGDRVHTRVQAMPN